MAGGTRKRDRKRPTRKKDTSDKPQMQDWSERGLRS
jgi:hypothetical protein